MLRPVIAGSCAASAALDLAAIVQPGSRSLAIGGTSSSRQRRQIGHMLLRRRCASCSLDDLHSDIRRGRGDHRDVRV